MTIERFTKTQFEEALPRHKTTDLPIFEYAGISQGEFTYLAKIDDQVLHPIYSIVEIIKRSM